MNPFPRRKWLTALPAALLACASLSAFAQSDKPPARIIVGFPAGGGFDGVARLLADKMRTELKRPVVVDNRAGAGGRIAVDVLKAAPRDGSVVMLGPDALVALYPFTMRKINYDPAKDLQPIGTVTEFPFTFATGTQPAVKTLKEFITWSKGNPNKVNYGIPARGAPHHFFGIVLSQTIGVPMEDIPYQGSAPMLTDLMGGQISAGIDVMGSTLEQHRAGKLRIVAVSSEQRVPQLPDVPTFAELGYPGITGMGFNALYAPSGTSKEHIAEWSQALVKTLAIPEVRGQLMNMGSLPVGKGPEELDARGKQAAARWAPVIKASGFIAD
jgi:tripartite-type tricarboxylate transporter receptor subunit TctC